MPMTHRKCAERYGVTPGAIQGWERRGFNREWTLEEMDQWREVHARGRVRIPLPAPVQAAPAPEPEPEAAPTPAPAAPRGPSAESVISQAMGFQETRTLKLRKEIERLSIIIGREKGELVSAEEMRETATRVVAVWCSELDALVGDLPGQLAGLTEAEIQPKLRGRIELLKANARDGFSGL
jgi:hypothetical protein